MNAYEIAMYYQHIILFLVISCELPVISYCKYEPIAGYFGDIITLECCQGYWFSRKVSTLQFVCNENSDWQSTTDKSTIISNETVCKGNESRSIFLHATVSVKSSGDIEITLTTPLLCNFCATFECLQTIIHDRA